MRIISGIHKGRILHPPKNLPVRPTTDFAKTALFNMIQNQFDFEDIKVLDLFSGTGAISVEFASRGCLDITSVDKHNGCVAFLQKSINELKIDTIRAFKEDVFSFILKNKMTYDLIFADPPYELKQMQEIPSLILSKSLLNKDGWLIVEHGDQTKFDEEPYFYESRRYGNVNFSIFKF